LNQQKLLKRGDEMAIAKMMGRMGKMVADMDNKSPPTPAKPRGAVGKLMAKMGDEAPTPVAKPRRRGAVLKAAGMGSKGMATGFSKGGSADKTGRAMKKTTADAKGRAMKKGK
jgi:hypothetical protein